jgi:hypothetical protein
VQSELELAYDQIGRAMVDSAKDRSSGAACAEAERLGLTDIGNGKASQKHIWERQEGKQVLRFMWRWYDQSRPFSIQPDMNIMSVELSEGAALLRSCEERFED